MENRTACRTGPVYESLCEKDNNAAQARTTYRCLLLSYWYDMTSQVLVPMNDSERATKALEFALETYTDAEFTVLNVIGVPTWHMGSACGLALSSNPSEAARAQAESVFEAAREVASRHDVEVITIIDVGDPSRAITKRAEDFDIVVIGGHERELSSRLLIGNVATTVTRRSPVPVTVVG